MTDFILGMRDSKKSALAGQDVEMPFHCDDPYRDLKDLVERGEVPVERIDDACIRLLRQQVRFGQGRNPQDYPPERSAARPAANLPREAAQKSIVLLKNEGNLLPLKGVKNLAVVGRLAETPNIGDAGLSNTLPPMWSRRWKDCARRWAKMSRSPMTMAATSERAAAAVRGADAALIVVGYTDIDEGELVSPTIPAFEKNFPEPTPEEQPILATRCWGMADAAF